MELVRICPTDRENWLEFRRNGIGGSDAAASVGLSPWKTPIELWREKTGARSEIDLSEKLEVAEGVRMEAPLRDLFFARHPEFEWEYHPIDILHQQGRPELFATLDGEFWRKDDQKRNRWVLEIKRSAPQRKCDWGHWDNRVPDHYYLQILHQLLATGYFGAVLFAALIRQNGEIILREYVFRRSDQEEDLSWYSTEAARFWKYVKDRKMPPQRLIL